LFQTGWLVALELSFFYSFHFSEVARFVNAVFIPIRLFFLDLIVNIYLHFFFKFLLDIFIIT
jgi:hypothetical protein